MKNLCVIATLLAALLVVSNAVAQTAGRPATDEFSGPSGIAAARSKYLENAADTAATKDSQTEAQLPRRGRGMPIPPRRGYNRGGYPTPWMANSDPSHVLIGAGIGFVIGATIGAVGAVHNGTQVGSGVFIGGSLFGLLGAAIGASHGTGHPSMHRRRTYPVWPDDDEEGALRSPAVPKNSRAMFSASGKPALPRQPREGQASTAASPEIQPVPDGHSAQTASSPKTQQWQNFSGQLKPW
jgi:hypothetical protein